MAKLTMKARKAPANAKAKASQVATKGKLSPAAASRIRSKANAMLKGGC